MPRGTCRAATSTGTQNWLNTNTSAADVYFDGDNVTFDTAHNSTGTFNISLNTTVFPGSVTVSSGAYTFSGGGIAGSTGLNVTGGSLNLQTAGTYTGNTTVSGGGMLQISGGGSVTGSAIKIQNGTVQLATSTALPATANVTLGDGGTNSGLLDLDGQNITIGSLSVSGTGTTNAIGNSSSSPATFAATGGVSIAGASLRIVGNTSSTLSAVGGLGGNLIIGDGGTPTSVTLSAVNSYTGSTTINAGSTLTVPAGGSIATNSGVILNDGTEIFANTTPAANFGTGTTINVNAAGSLLQYGANALVGALSTPITIASGGALTVDVHDSNTTTKDTYLDSGAITGSGPLTIENTGSDPVDTYQLGGNNSGYSGNITVPVPVGGSAIRLQATTVNGIGSGSVTIANGSQVFFSTGGTYTNTFNIAGVGTGTDVPPFGAVRLANTQTLTGPINLTGNALITIGTNASSTAIISGPINGVGNTLTLQSGTFTV